MSGRLPTSDWSSLENLWNALVDVYNNFSWTYKPVPGSPFVFQDGESFTEGILHQTVDLNAYLKIALGDDEYARWKWLLQDAPGVGAFIKFSDNVQFWTDYFKNTGLSWSDVLYPSRLSGGGFASSLNYVSDNVRRLYR